MKPLLLLLLILIMAGCNAGGNTNATKAVCSKVVADCCGSVSATSIGDYKCQVKTRSLGDDLFSVSMHEITKEMFTW